MNTLPDVVQAVDDALDVWRDSHDFAPLKFEVNRKDGAYRLLVRPLSIEWPPFDVELNEAEPAADAHYMALLMLKDYELLIPPPTTGRTVTTSDISGI